VAEAPEQSVGGSQQTFDQHLERSHDPRHTDHSNGSHQLSDAKHLTALKCRTQQAFVHLEDNVWLSKCIIYIYYISILFYTILYYIVLIIMYYIVIFENCVLDHRHFHWICRQKKKLWSLLILVHLPCWTCLSCFEQCDTWWTGKFHAFDLVQISARDCLPHLFLFYLRCQATWFNTVQS
jgi:hypothetical protein